MNSIRILRVFIFISAVGITYVMAAPSTPKEETPQVPMIEDCAFVDAYSVTCWWKRPPDDDKTTYRLGHLSSSYHPDENDEKYCESVRSRVTDHGVEIEECGFEKASLYQRFTFWVEVVTVVEDKYYPTGVKGQMVTFTAAASTVKLTAPPHDLNIDKDGQFLTWSEPEREGSLLIYVTNTRDLFYKVECRNHSTEKQDIWQECYQGYESKFPVSDLIPEASYDVRVFASLDYEFPDDEDEDEREWSDPSDVLVYEVSASSEPTAITVNGHVKVAAIIAPVVIILAALLIVGGFLMYWKGHCCFEIKFIRPSAFIELDAKSDETDPSETALMDGFSNRTEERIHPVTMSDEFDWIVNDLRHKKGGTYTITIANEMAEDDLKRHFLRSFYPDNARSSMQDETCSNVSDNSDSDIIRREMLAKQKQKFQSKRSLDEESIQYMKLVANDAGLPTYTLTDSDGKSESHGSQESIDTEYVMEYTAVDPTSIPSVPYSLAKTPQSQRDHPKNCHIAEMLEESEFPYGAIPDYVMQTSVSYEDFARTMTSFLHTLTHAEHHKENDDETTQQKHRTAELLPDCSLRSHLTNHESTMSRDLDYCDGRLQCYDSEDEHPSHTAQKDSNKVCGFQPEDLSATKSKAVLSRSGSGSLPSIDSGYSAETPEIS